MLHVYTYNILKLLDIVSRDSIQHTITSSPNYMMMYIHVHVFDEAE